MNKTKEEIQAMAQAKYPYCLGVNDAIIDLERVAYIAGFTDCQNQSGWISVEERLPDHFRNVLAATGKGFIRITWIDKGTMLFDVMELREEVNDHYTHWQPLPPNP